MAQAKDSNKEFEMTDERRMRISGAEESGYHAPTAQDIEDIKKDHHTHTAPNAVNADAFIRDGSSTGELQGAEDDENLHPQKGIQPDQARSLGTLADEEEEGISAEGHDVKPPTSGDQSIDDHHGFRGAKRTVEGSGPDGDLNLEGPSDGVVAEGDEESEILGRRSA
ncbi:MAG: hypothetical protein EOP11_02955 [Proteobacteria bacterium]|nr:MAG: hypothetical protein EOP11_02955 [Pseudomonadota bacterium]